MAYDWMWFETGLPRELAELIAKDARLFEQEAKEALVFGDSVADAKDKTKNKRSTRVSWIPDTHWIGGMVMHYANKVNKSNFHYDLSGLDWDALQYGIYGVGDHYDWHTDYCLDNTAQISINNTHGFNEDRANSLRYLTSEYVRKLSFSLQLSEEAEYEGGELEVTDSENKKHTISQRLGTIVFFDSRVVHRVKPVTQGERRSIVGWVVGPRWK